MVDRHVEGGRVSIALIRFHKVETLIVTPIHIAPSISIFGSQTILFYLTLLGNE